MCKCTCRRGAQGKQGPQGETGPTGTLSLNQTRIGVKPISAQTDLVVIASAASSGNLFFFGQLEIDSNSSIKATVTVLINATAQTNVLTSFTTGTGGAFYVVIPVSDLLTVTTADSVSLRVELSDYTKSATAFGRVQYGYL